MTTTKKNTLSAARETSRGGGATRFRLTQRDATTAAPRAAGRHTTRQSLPGGRKDRRARPTSGGRCWRPQTAHPRWRTTPRHCVQPVGPIERGKAGVRSTRMSQEKSGEGDGVHGIDSGIIVTSTSCTTTSGTTERAYGVFGCARPKRTLVARLSVARVRDHCKPRPEKAR